MSHRVWPLFFLLVLMMIGGCVQSNMSGRVVSPEDPAKTRTEIIERLVPEDGVMSRRRLGAVVEATTTVISDLDKRRFPQNAKAVREVLQRASLPDLRRIEAILPEVERKRQIERSRLTGEAVIPSTPDPPSAVYLYLNRASLL